MSTPIQVTHSEVVITYDESSDKWLFTLRGRDRSADTLAKAREAIDKPIPQEKAKPFEKFSAWLFQFAGVKPVLGEVTGIAEARGWKDSPCVWFTHKGSRRKEDIAFAIYPSSPRNDTLVQTIISKVDEMARIREEIDAMKNLLEPLVLPKEE